MDNQLFYGEGRVNMTVKQLRDILETYRDDDVVTLYSSGGEWSEAKLCLSRGEGCPESVVMEVDG